MSRCLICLGYTSRARPSLSGRCTWRWWAFLWKHLIGSRHISHLVFAKLFSKVQWRHGQFDPWFPITELKTCSSDSISSLSSLPPLRGSLSPFLSLVLMCFSFRSPMVTGAGRLGSCLCFCLGFCLGS